MGPGCTENRWSTYMIITQVEDSLEMSSQITESWAVNLGIALNPIIG